MKIRKYYIITFVFSMTILFLLTFFLGKYISVKNKNYIEISDNIYVEYKDKKDTILLLNLKSISEEDALKNPNNNVSFKIYGDNIKNQSYKYTISLDKADPVYLKQFVNDELLSFRLTEIENEKEKIIFDKVTLNEINNNKILTYTISPNNVKLQKEYKLTMWIDEDLNINLSDIYIANIKIKVEGQYYENN